jgi:hypothetical protein
MDVYDIDVRDRLDSMHCRRCITEWAQAQGDVLLHVAMLDWNGREHSHLIQANAVALRLTLERMLKQLTEIEPGSD